MEKINSFFNKEKQQFEVWKIDEENKELDKERQKKVQTEKNKIINLIIL